MIGTVDEGPVIELRRLHRTFGDTHAVNDVSFSVPRGSVFGYIGPNGAGKTTSMRILATLELPTSGEAYVAGFSSVNDPDRVRRRLGFMPDGFGTYADTNCAEYLDFFARSYGVLGRPEDATRIWADARRAFADAPDALAFLRGAAEEAGADLSAHPNAAAPPALGPVRREDAE